MKKHAHSYSNRNKNKSFEYAEFHKEFHKEIEEIKKRSKVGDPAYQFNESDKERIIELLVIAKDLPEKYLYDSQHCMHTILFMVMNTIDKKLAKDLAEMFKKHKFKSHHIEASISGQLMRMSGH